MTSLSDDRRMTKAAAVTVMGAVLILAGTVPVAAEDATTSAQAKLSAWCAAPTYQQPAPLALLLALADGRSAAEFAAVFRAPGCPTGVQVRGAGDDELIAATVGGAGALLWV